MKKELELYELVLLFKLSPADGETSKRVEKYKQFLTEKGSQVMVKNHGKKSLAYPIKGFEMATSVQLVYLGNDSLIRQINTQIQRDDSILRGLTTKLVDPAMMESFTS